MQQNEIVGINFIVFFFCYPSTYTIGILSEEYMAAEFCKINGEFYKKTKGI